MNPDRDYSSSNAFTADTAEKFDAVARQTAELNELVHGIVERAPLQERPPARNHYKIEKIVGQPDYISHDKDADSSPDSGSGRPSAMDEIGTFMDMEYGVCSTSAAALARRAREILAEPHARNERTFYVPDRLNGSSQLHVNAVRVSDPTRTRNYREVQLYLTAENLDESTPSYLLAVTRGDIALPVASFTRRPGSDYCDYVQILDEIYDDTDLVVTSGDEFSRRELLDSLREFLDIDPMIFELKAAIQDAKENYSTDKFIQDIKERYFGYDRTVRNDLKRAFLKTEGLFDDEIHSLLAILMECDEDFSGNRDGIYLLEQTAQSAPKVRTKFGETDAVIRKFIRKPDIQKILDGSAPGCENEMARRLLLLNATKKMKLSRPTDKSDKHVLEMLEIEERLESFLGRYDPMDEQVVSLAGKLAVHGEQFDMTEEDMPIGTTTDDMFIRVGIQTTGNTSNRINVDARPVSLSDEPLKTWFDAYVDRAGELDLTPQRKVILHYILKKLAEQNGLAGQEESKKPQPKGKKRRK